LGTEGPPPPSLARGALLNLVGQAVPLAIGGVTLPFIIRHMSPEAFGLLALLWAVLGYFGIFDLGLSASTTKLVAEAAGKTDPAAVSRIAWNAIVLHLGAGTAFGLIMALSVPAILSLIHVPVALTRDVRLSLYVLAGAVPVVVTTGAFRGILDAHRRFDLVNKVRVLAGSGTFLVPLVVLLLGGGLPGITLSLLALRLVSALVFAQMCRPLIGPSPWVQGLDPQTTGALVSFGGWILVSSILGPIFTYLDRALISTLISIQAVGYYSPPYEIVSRLAIIPASVSMVLFPTVSGTAFGKRAELHPLIERLTRFMLVIMTPIVVGLATFAEPLLLAWLGPVFAREGATVMKVLALGMLPNALAYVPYTVINGLGRPDLTAKTHLAELLLYGVGAWYLTRAGGIVGAAVAWSLFLLLDAILLFAIMGYQLSTPLHTVIASAKRLAPVVSSVVALGLAMASLGALVHVLVLKAVLAVALLGGFAWTAWFRILGADDRTALLAAVRLQR